MIRQGELKVPAVRMQYLECGDEAAPTVFLVHGFPDDAWTWASQMSVLEAEGFRVIAPFLRGYPPSEVPADRRTSSPLNASDLVELVSRLSSAPAFVIGHDWGGLATYGAVAAAPELFAAAASVAVSHPATLLAILENPSLVAHLFHIWFFQLEGLSEAALRANDFALVDFLWERWAADGQVDSGYISRLKRDVFTNEGVVETLLSYYRALVRLPQDEPEFVARAISPTSVPFLAIWGSQDPAREAADHERPYFIGGYERVDIRGAGHFVHREQPDAFNDAILTWLRQHATSTGPQASATT